MKTTISIEFREDGTTRMTVGGIKGKLCTDVTKFLDDGMGIRGERHLTGDYYAQPLGRASVSRGRGTTANRCPRWGHTP